ncbi:MAG TPA: hypothetical protein VFR21_15720, partial [Bradyrhizobium sp.]|nr:hypothetical protein [Bradyrhizobium sp.]
RRRSEIGTMDKDARQERLKQALRENLKRRKAQARQRATDEPAPVSLHEAALEKDNGDRDA